MKKTLSPSDYAACVDFIPPRGLLGVEHSGVYLVGQQEDYLTGLTTRLKRTRNILRILRHREGAFFTTPETTQSVQEDIVYYSKRHDGLKRLKKDHDWNQRLEGSYGPDNSGFDTTSSKLYFKITGAFRQLDRFLQSGFRAQLKPDQLPVDEVDSFMVPYRFFHGSESDAVRKTLLQGNNAGILTGNERIMEAYADGVQEFGLEGCFIADALRAETFDC